MNIQDSRILIKRSTLTGVVPTVPASQDHTDGSWIDTDIYKGEWFINLADSVAYTRVDSGIIPISGLAPGCWNIAGNTLAARAKIGSISGNFGFDFYKNNVINGGLANDAKWYFGTSAAFTDTSFSYKSLGNDSSTYHSQFTNSSSTVLGWLRDDGLLNAVGGIGTNGFKVLSDNVAARRYIFGYNAGLGATSNYAFFCGEDAGQNSTNNHINALGYQAAINNIGESINAFGIYSAAGNDGSFLNCFGQSSGSDGTGSYGDYFGFESGRLNTGTHNKFFGYRCGISNTFSEVFAASVISNIFWNNIGDKGNTTLQTVTMQSAMSEDGTNTSAAASIMRYAAARATGNALGGDVQYMYSAPEASGTTRQSLALSAAMKGSTGVWEFEKDIKFNVDSTGVILKDRTTATNYRLYVDSGALLIESV